MIDCKECRRLRLRYQDCGGRDFYSYGDLVFCPFQITWVLRHLEELKAGFWPQKPLTEEEEKANLPSLGRVATVDGGSYGNAGFERACSIAGEVERRIDKTGKDGLLFRTRYSENYRDEDISKLAIKMGMPIDEVERIIDSVLRYVRGWRQKGTPYHQWKSSRHYYQKVTKSPKSTKT